MMKRVTRLLMLFAVVLPAYADVELPKDRLVDRLRMEQNAFFSRNES